MEQMEKIQNIIRIIYCNNDMTSMKRQVASLLKELIDFDFVCIDEGTSQNAKPVITDSLIISNLGAETERHYMSMYESTYEPIDYLSWIYSLNETTIYRLSDIVSDAFRYKTTFYQDFLSKFYLDYAVGLVFVANKKFCGDITFIRAQGKPDFSDDAMDILSLLLPHLEVKFVENSASSTSASGSYILKNNYKLTRREIEMVKCIYNDMPNAMIAETLSIAPATVKKHIANLFSKLEVGSRAGLMKFILDNDLSDLCRKL